MPKKRGVISEPEFEENNVEIKAEKKSFPSPLWDYTVRDSVTLTKRPDSEINKMRSESLIPGVSELKLNDEESRIPIMLIQR